MDQPQEESISEEIENPEVTESEVKEGEVSETDDPKQEASSESDVTSEKEDWFLPGRYKTKEEAVSALRYFESENSRRANELHRLKTERVKSSVDPEQEKLQFAEAVKRNPVEAVRDVVKSEIQDVKLEAKKVRFESEYSRLMQNKEFQELEPVMGQIAQQYGEFLDDEARNDPKLLHILFYAAKGVKSDEHARKAAEKAKSLGERAALKKTKAQVEGASGTKGHVKKKFEDLSLEEMRKDILKGNV